MSLRTMSWAETLTDSSTRNPTRHSSSSSLNSYVPPHLRHNSSSLSGEGYTPFVPRHLRHNSSYSGDGYTPYGRGGSSSFAQPRDYNRGGGGRGRGGARSRGWFQSPNQRPPTRDLSSRGDVAAEFEKLQVSEGGKEEDDDNVGGINFEAYEDIPVEASGEDVPAPASTFEEIDLGECLDNNIKRCRYTNPTPVQRHAIPIALAGRDLMACAQTGSGKTAAFCFPIISGVLTKCCLTKSNDNYTAFPAALILSPTRELASQIYEEARKFAANSGAKLAVVYGGAAIGQQLRCLERGVDILVATPGRLVDMVERERVSLERIKYLVLDEADRMLDMGFEQQIRRIVEQMGMPLPGARQTLLFSATFPQEIQRLAADFLRNYIFLTVGRVGSSTDLIAQKVEFVRDMDKLNHLSGILKNQRSNGTNGKMALTLVFVETKKGADQLENWLCRNGFRATAIHGDKVQFERERALNLFKCGTTPILVATDVASRGLDIPHVAHVINFDFPKCIDDYVHRIGRTGRAGKSGLATAFFTEKNQSLAQGLAEVMKESKQEVPKWLNDFAEQSSCYGGDQGQRNGSRNFGGYDFRRSENHYGSVGAPAVSFNSGSYGYGGDCGAYSADAPAATFSDPSYTIPSGVDNNVAGSADATGFGNYDNIVAGGWD